jgi:CRP-like cAMP-binding protein
MTVSEVKFQSDLMSAEDAQLLLPKLTDEQLAMLKSYGATEKTSIGQVLATAGDFTYDLMVVLDGEVECSDIHDGRRRSLLVHRPRDFIAELDLLTGQRVYTTFVVTEAGSIIRVPRSAVKAIIDADATLGTRARLHRSRSEPRKVRRTHPSQAVCNIVVGRTAIAAS